MNADKKVRNSIQSLVLTVEASKDWLIRYEGEGYPLEDVDRVKKWLFEATTVEPGESGLEVQEGDGRINELAIELYRVSVGLNCIMEMTVLEDSSSVSVSFPDSDFVMTMTYPDPFQLLKAVEDTIIRLKELYSA